MIKPDELESKAGQLTWDTIVAAAEGDVIALRQLLKQNPRLALSEYWYTDESRPDELAAPDAASPPLQWTR